jgi:CspA family cold shock protein
MVNGTVKFFNRTKNYGFINGDDGKTYFVHGTGLKDGVMLDEGDKVTFTGSEGDKGPKAESVEKLKE